MTNRLQSENNIVIRISTVIWELFFLNLLTLLCCLPILTIGASLTALHDGLIRILRKEDGYLARRFFSVFRENLKQATILWLPFLLIFLGVGADAFILLTAPELLPRYITIPAGVAGLLTLYLFQWVYPVQSRFSGGPWQVLKTALFLAVARFPRTAAMTMMWILPVIGTKFLFTLPIVLLFGISLPAMLCALFYYPVFRELEETEET